MRKKVCRFILHLLGWKVEVSVPDYPKCVICVAPHTSNTDFFLGKLAYLSIGRHAGFLIKKDWFFFPLNIIFRSMGGIPVDRSKHCHYPRSNKKKKSGLEKRILFYRSKSKCTYRTGIYRL